MSVIGKLSGLFRSGRPEAKGGHPALAEVIRLVDPRLAAIPDHAAALSAAIGHASDYFEAQVTAIPGPIGVSRFSHADDPLVNALFPSVDDIQAALGRSIEVRDALAGMVESGQRNAHALLGIRPKRTDAAEGGDGESAPAFVDHTFRSLGSGEHDARRYLRDAALSSLVKAFAARLNEERRKHKLLKSELALNKELERPASDAAAQARTRRQRDPVLDEYFARTAKEFTPEAILEALVKWLSTPEVQMRLQIGAGDGVVASAAQQGPLALPLLTSNDRRQWLVCFARFSVDEAARAIEQEARSHRYILI